MGCSRSTSGCILVEISQALGVGLVRPRCMAAFEGGQGPEPRPRRLMGIGYRRTWMVIEWSRRIKN